MKIVIDLTSLSYHMTGIERYAACVSEQIIKQDKYNQYYLIFRDDIYPSFTKYINGNRIRAIVLTGSNKLFFYQFVLYKALNKINADKYLFFAFISPMLFRKSGIINTIHDMGAWDSANTMKISQKIYWRMTLKHAAKISEKIITVSNFSKSRIKEILKYPEEKIEVVYSAIYDGVIKSHDLSFSDIKKEYKLPDKYIMTLSTLEPRKNLNLLLDGYTKIQNKVDYDLVLVGREGWRIKKIIAKFNKEGRVHITGFVKDEHVSAIYKNAICFIFPSLYEGFGLPPIEALASGTPVISSNAASMPEILRNQAVYFENNNEDELIELLLNLETNLPNMVCDLDEFQKEQYKFDLSAKKIIERVLREE